MIAYDLCHAEEVRDSVIAKSGRSSSFKLIPRVKLSGPEDADGDTVPLNGMRPTRGTLSRLSLAVFTSYNTAKDEGMLNEDEFLARSLDERKEVESVA